MAMAISSLHTALEDLFSFTKRQHAMGEIMKVHNVIHKAYGEETALEV
jgi:hypothetical protein